MKLHKMEYVVVCLTVFVISASFATSESSFFIDQLFNIINEIYLVLRLELSNPKSIEYYKKL